MSKCETGTVSDIDEAKVCVRVRLPDCDNLRTAWLPVLQQNSQNNKDYWLPDIGEQVKVLLDENGEDGLVLGTIYSAVDTAPVASRDKRYVRFSDGAAFEYDRASHQLTINGGIEVVLIEAKSSVTIKAQSVMVDSPKTTFKGDVTVEKKLTYQGGMSGSGGEGSAAVINGNVTVQGNVNASGSVMDSGGNSNHHSH